MMIMGMCLQGIIANPAFSSVTEKDDRGFTTLRVMTPDELKAQVSGNIKLAHQYADALDPPPPIVQANAVADLTRVAYEALRALGLLVDVGLPWADAKGTEEVDPVFDMVQLYYLNPFALVGSTEERLVRAIVRASTPEGYQQRLFDEADAPGHERQGSGRDPGAAGHERQGRG